jgi:hypothetical protein
VSKIEQIPYGYIIFPRLIKNCPAWVCLKPTYKVIFMELLLQAKFKDGEVVRNQEVIYLKRGQIATSYQHIVNDINSKEITVKVVRSAIKKLISVGFLQKDEAVARAKKGLLLTLPKYCHYQNPENYKGKAFDQVTGSKNVNQGQSGGITRAINNNVNNNDNKENKVKRNDWSKLREEVLEENE